MQKIFGTFLIAICLFSALAIFAEFLLPKVCYYPAIIEQPIAQGRKQHRASQNNKPSNKNQQKTPSFVTAIEGIERAIRDAIPQENKSHDDWQINKDIRDLSAQERMAFEACKMYWATFGTAFLAFGGICFLWRDIAVSRKTGVDQSRAYVFVDKAKFYWGSRDKTNPHVVLSVKNSGQSPAKWISVYSRITVTRIPVKGISHRISPPDSREKIWTPDWKEISRWSALGTDSSITVSGESLTADEKTALKDSLCELAIDGTVRYETIFGEITESEFSFIIRKPGDYNHKPISPTTMDKGQFIFAKFGGGIEVPYDMKIANARLRIFDIVKKSQTKET